MDKADQLLQIITGILDISRMEAGEMHFDLGAFDLQEVVSVALSTVAPTVRRRRLIVTSQLAEGLPNVFADRKKVRQVLLNLLGNAVKFTSEGGIVRLYAEPGTIARSGEGPVGVRVGVVDSGIGVAPEHHAQLFEPFYQVDNSTTREFGGTGLGLSIVKRFVEGMGGSVWVESDVGQGATFVFTLPAAPKEGA
jgi:signal transduction histidine kinase